MRRQGHRNTQTTKPPQEETSMKFVELVKKTAGDWPLWALGAATLYIFIVPVSNNILLFPLLFLLGVFAFINSLNRGIQIPRTLGFAILGWLIFLILGIFTGLLMNAESLLRTLVFLAVWPGLFITIALGYSQKATVVMLRAGAIATALISVTFIIGALNAVGTIAFNPIPQWFLSLIAFRYVTDDAGVFALSSHSLPSLMWWTPIWIASLLIRNAPPYFPPLWARWVLAVLGTAAVVISWRRAIVLTILLIPLVIFAVAAILFCTKAIQVKGLVDGAKRVPIVASTYLAAGGISLLVQPMLATLISQLIASLRSVIVGTPTIQLEGTPPQSEGDVAVDDKIADSLRANEAQVLTSWNSLTELLFGRGFGATIDRGAVERDMAPWQTELQYHLIFYWTGVVGLALLGFIITVCCVAVLRAGLLGTSLNPTLFIVSIGAMAALIGNATNPYLQAPGHLWAAFWPMMIASAILTAHDGDRAIQLTSGIGRRKRIRQSDRGIAG